MSKVIVTGAIAYDDIMNFPGVFGDYIKSDKIHQLNVSFVVDKLEKQIGGTATNIAYNLNLLSKGSAYIVAAVGKDSETILSWLNDQKMPADGIVVDDSLFTASGKAITDKNDNQIWGFYYGASAVSKDIDPRKHIEKGDAMIISANHVDSFEHFQTYAIENDIEYLYDPGMVLTSIHADVLKEGVKHCTWLVANDYEMSRVYEITGFTADELIESGVHIITTLGSKGVHYADKKTVLEVPGYTIDNPTDPTGAGDAWRGGFFAGVRSGLSTEESLIQGNALASFAVEKYGTINHKPSPGELSERKAFVKKLLKND